MFLLGFATMIKVASAAGTSSAPHLDFAMLANFALVSMALLSFGKYLRSHVYAFILFIEMQRSSTGHLPRHNCVCHAAIIGREIAR